MSFKIDKEFESFWPPLTTEKLNELEQDLLTNGLRDNLVVWKEEGLLLDGHQRFSILKKHNITIPAEKISELPFPGRSFAMLWILTNQKERRGDVGEFVSTTNVLKCDVPGGPFDKMGDAAKVQAGKLYGEKHPKRSTIINGEPLGKFDRNQLMAEKAGVGKTTVEKVKYIRTHDPKLYNELDQKARTTNEDISVDTAYGQVKQVVQSRTDVGKDPKAVLIVPKAVQKITTRRNVEAFGRAVRETKASPKIQEKIAEVIAKDEKKDKTEEDAKSVKITAGPVEKRTEVIRSLITQEQVQEKLGPKKAPVPKTPEQIIIEGLSSDLDTIFQQASALHNKVVRFISDLKHHKVEELDGIATKLGGYHLSELMKQLVRLSEFFKTNKTIKGEKKCPKLLTE